MRLVATYLYHRKQAWPFTVGGDKACGIRVEHPDFHNVKSSGPRKLEHPFSS